MTVVMTELAAKLCWVALLRGLAALALGVYLLSRAETSPPALARAVAVYWIVDGAAALWASVVAARVATKKMLLIVRTVVAIAAALFMLGLPLRESFGAWRPGQLLIFVWTLALVLAVIALQVILAATFDVLVSHEVRRRIPGEWSLLVAASLSIVLGVLVAASFLAQPAVLGSGLGVAGVAGGLGLIVGAVRLRTART